MNKISLRSSAFHLLPRSLRWRATLAVLGSLIVILGIFTFIEYQDYRAALQKNYSMIASEAGQVIETNLRHDMVKSDFEGVQNILDSIQQTQGFQEVYILNLQGEVIFSSQKKNVGRFLDDRQPDCTPCHQLPAEQRPSSMRIVTAGGTNIFRSVNLIQNGPACNKCHDPNQATIGLLLTDISTSAINTGLDAQLKKNLIWRFVTILVTILVVALVLDYLVLRRLESFSKVLSDFGHKQQAPQLTADQPDEIGNLISTFQMMAQQIESRNSENQALSEDLKHQNEVRGELLKQLITAQESERTRVARELHDELGQALTSLSLQAEVVQKTLKKDPEGARQYIQQIQTLIRETTDCMYDLILDLRPSVLDDLGLVAAIRAQAERSFAGKDVQLELDDELTGRLPAELETVLYRIYQEALSNIVRHAKATYVRVGLTRLDGHFRGEIADNGVGFNPDAVQSKVTSRGLGLLGMRERITQCGGQLEIQSKPGMGTKIQITIPINEASNG